MTKRKKPLAAGLTQAIGGLLVGFDEQVFRATPRVEERYKRRDEVSLAAAEGGTLVVGLPDDTPPIDPGPAPTTPPPRPRSPA
jgi:hypothetical protein